MPRQRVRTAKGGSIASQAVCDSVSAEAFQRLDNNFTNQFNITVMKGGNIVDVKRYVIHNQQNGGNATNASCGTAAASTMTLTPLPPMSVAQANGSIANISGSAANILAADISHSGQVPSHAVYPQNIMSDFEPRLTTILGGASKSKSKPKSKQSDTKTSNNKKAKTQTSKTSKKSKTKSSKATDRKKKNK